MIPSHQAVTSEEQDQQIRFRTYSKYVRALADILNVKDYPNCLIEEIVSSRSFQGIQGRQCLDIQRVGELLRNAWFTEFQLNLPTRAPDFIPYSIHWVTVQAYYVMYLQLRAYFMASGQAISHEHASTLRAISNELLQKSNLFPTPWRTLCTDTPNNMTPILTGVPIDTKIEPLSPLLNYENSSPWSWYALFLKTTRQRQVTKACDDWKRTNKRKKIPSNERASIVQNLGPTTFFNAFYRLRIRSNYEDADSFLMGALHTDPKEASQFHQDICSLVWDTSLVFEILVARCITKKTYKIILSDFVDKDRLKLSRTLAFQRWQLMATAW